MLLPVLVVVEEARNEEKSLSDNSESVLIFFLRYFIFYIKETLFS